MFRKDGFAWSKPFKWRRQKIVHCSYHKMGTVWFSRILEKLSVDYGLSFQKINDNISDLDTSKDIIVLNHSDICFSSKQRFKGSHMVRDLRDVIVSGYFYHLWTKEQWANVPSKKFGGSSYVEYLNGLSRAEGISTEIRNFSEYALDRRMRDWNYQDVRFLELRYEDVFNNEEELFEKVFRHYGFSNNAIGHGLKVVEFFSFENQKKKSGPGKHLRSGKPGEWEEHFTQHHKELFKELLGDLLIQLNYADDMNW